MQQSTAEQPSDLPPREEELDEFMNGESEDDSGVPNLPAGSRERPVEPSDSDVDADAKTLIMGECDSEPSPGAIGDEAEFQEAMQVAGEERHAGADGAGGSDATMRTPASSKPAFFGYPVVGTPPKEVAC